MSLLASYVQKNSQKVSLLTTEHSANNPFGRLSISYAICDRLSFVRRLKKGRHR